MRFAYQKRRPKRNISANPAPEKKQRSVAYRIMLCSFLSFLLLCFLPSCALTTAVKGVPVGTQRQNHKSAISSSETIQTQLKGISPLSNVTENNVFQEVDGVPEYRIGPSDVLEIHSHVGSEVTPMTLTVSSRGRISYSFIDDLEVAGLTPSQLDELLTDRLSSYVRYPRIDVFMKEFNSKKAFVLGELASIRSGTQASAPVTGKIFLKGKTTLVDLIAMAGGYTVDADLRTVKLKRKGRTYVINLFNIMEKGDERWNVVIDDGDVVDIPELPTYGERVYVLGEVEKQGVYPLKDTRDLLAAVALGGGFTPVAKEENTLIVRAYEPGGKPHVMMADVSALLKQADLSQNIQLQDGDLVYVPRMIIGDVNEWIRNTIPLLDYLFYPQKYKDAY
jgi:polysaccharide export outer membrane protein